MIILNNLSYVKYIFLSVPIYRLRNGFLLDYRAGGHIGLLHRGTESFTTKVDLDSDQIFNNQITVLSGGIGSGKTWNMIQIVKQLSVNGTLSVISCFSNTHVNEICRILSLEEIGFALVTSNLEDIASEMVLVCNFGHIGTQGDAPWFHDFMKNISVLVSLKKAILFIDEGHLWIDSLKWSFKTKLWESRSHKHITLNESNKKPVELYYKLVYSDRVVNLSSAVYVNSDLNNAVCLNEWVPKEKENIRFNTESDLISVFNNKSFDESFALDLIFLKNDELSTWDVLFDIFKYTPRLITIEKFGIPTQNGFRLPEQTGKSVTLCGINIKSILLIKKLFSKVIVISSSITNEHIEILDDIFGTHGEIFLDRKNNIDYGDIMILDRSMSPNTIGSIFGDSKTIFNTIHFSSNKKKCRVLSNKLFRFGYINHQISIGGLVEWQILGNPKFDKNISKLWLCHRQSRESIGLNLPEINVVICDFRSRNPISYIPKYVCDEDSLDEYLLNYNTNLILQEFGRVTRNNRLHKYHILILTGLENFIRKDRVLNKVLSSENFSNFKMEDLGKLDLNLSKNKTLFKSYLSHRFGGDLLVCTFANYLEVSGEVPSINKETSRVRKREIISGKSVTNLDRYNNFRDDLNLSVVYDLEITNKCIVIGYIGLTDGSTYEYILIKPDSFEHDVKLLTNWIGKYNYYIGYNNSSYDDLVISKLLISTKFDDVKKFSDNFFSDERSIRNKNFIGKNKSKSFYGLDVSCFYGGSLTKQGNLFTYKPKYSLNHLSIGVNRDVFLTPENIFCDYDMNNLEELLNYNKSDIMITRDLFLNVSDCLERNFNVIDFTTTFFNIELTQFKFNYLIWDGLTRLSRMLVNLSCDTLNINSKFNISRKYYIDFDDLLEKWKCYDGFFLKSYLDYLESDEISCVSNRLYIGDVEYGTTIEKHNVTIYVTQGGIRINSIDEGFLLDDTGKLLSRIDAVSAYPFTLTNDNLLPDSINVFFNNLISKRLEAKKSGNKIVNEAYKEMINAFSGSYKSSMASFKLKDFRVYYKMIISVHLNLVHWVDEILSMGLKVGRGRTDGFLVHGDIKYLDDLNNFIKSWNLNHKLKIDVEHFNKFYWNKDYFHYIKNNNVGKVCGAELWTGNYNSFNYNRVKPGCLNWLLPVKMGISTLNIKSISKSDIINWCLISRSKTNSQFILNGERVKFLRWIPLIDSCNKGLPLVHQLTNSIKNIHNNILNVNSLNVDIQINEIDFDYYFNMIGGEKKLPEKSSNVSLTKNLVKSRISSIKGYIKKFGDTNLVYTRNGKYIKGSRLIENHVQPNDGATGLSVIMSDKYVTLDFDITKEGTVLFKPLLKHITPDILSNCFLISKSDISKSEIFNNSFKLIFKNDNVSYDKLSMLNDSFKTIFNCEVLYGSKAPHIMGSHHSKPVSYVMYNNIINTPNFNIDLYNSLYKECCLHTVGSSNILSTCVSKSQHRGYTGLYRYSFSSLSKDVLLSEMVLIGLDPDVYNFSEVTDKKILKYTGVCPCIINHSNTKDKYSFSLSMFKNGKLKIHCWHNGCKEHLFNKYNKYGYKV